MNWLLPSIAGVVFFLVIPGLVLLHLLLKLNRQRREYLMLFDSVPCTITVVDREFRLVRYNQEFERNFRPGRPKEYCFKAYKGLDTKCDQCPVEKTFKTGESCTSEEMRINRDGTRKHWIVKTAPVRDTRGEIVAAMEMCLDVTSRKRLEEELAKSEKKYFAIFNHIPNPVLVLHQDTFRILDCNRAVKSVYGYGQRELISRSFLDFFPEEERSQYSHKLARGQEMEISHARHLRKDDRIIHVTIRISPSEYLEHRVLLATISDITKRLQAEQQLSQAGKLATLGEMATGVAHELNQPLTVIKMASGFFLKKTRKQEPISPKLMTTMAQKIDTNVDRATEIIQHMRNFARKSSLKTSPVNLNEALETAFEIFSQQLKIRRIEVQWDLMENLPMIMAGRRRMEQVFINLLINARDAIDARYEEQEWDQCERVIFIRSAATERHVIVEVSDTGNGIPKAVAEKIFEPFFTTKEVGKGTGLGLSISYGIIKDFQGDIRITKNEYGGACFHLEFPIAREEQT